MRFLTTLPAVLLLCFSATAALAQTLPPSVSDALQQAQIPPEAIGIYVQKVDSDTVLLSSNRDQPFSPASTMKLVTTGAALELLGPAFRWKTQAFINGTLRGEILNGDLVIKGSGDPKLVMENLWLFLRRIRAAGVRHIRGDLVLDRSAFEERPYDAASFDNDPLKSYNAGPDALLLNFKSLNLSFTPDDATRKVRVVMEPPLDGVKLSAPKFVNDECGNWHDKAKPDINDDAVRFNGIYPSSCGEKTWTMHPYSMTNSQYFGSVFRHLWSELGGTFTGKVRNEVVPQSAQLIAEWQSPSLSEVVRDINKYSNNVMARQVLLTIPNQIMQVPATPELGVELVRQWLAKKNIYAPEMVIDNGSGLSRSARLSAGTLGRLLAAEYRSPVMPEFIASMPIIGIDGTMKKRLALQTASGNGHIKTGTLEGVRAIAGYVFAASGNRYAVVFIINDPHAESGKAAQDALLEWIYENG